MMPQPPSKVISIDAPIGGWNAFDSLDNMPPTDAIVLDNLIPREGTVDTRGGTVFYADTETGLPVETVASMDTKDTSLLIAASNGGVWKMSDSIGIQTQALAITLIAPTGTFLNDRWQTQNFRKADEEGLLIMCNGADEAQSIEDPYTAIGPMEFTDEDSVPIDDTKFIGVIQFKKRCYYWLDNDDSFWYTQAGSYQGVIKEFNLGSIAQKGGKLVLVTTWTQQDSGDGKDDFLVFVMSTGEILIYQGDDPESEGFFEMVGRYTTAEPLSVRGSSKYGSDTIIMTKDGYIALSTIVQEGRISDVPAFSKLISKAIIGRTDQGYSWFGWDCELYSSQSLFIFNVPLSSNNTTYEQHALNTVTQRWCRLKSINVNNFAVHQNRLFGGTNDGKIIAILEGTSDLGFPIEFTALPAFDYMGDPGIQKHITAAQVITTHKNPEFIELRGWSDFNWQFPPTPLAPDTKVSATWSVNPATPPVELGSFWDEDYWAVKDSPFTTKGWQNVSAYGYAVSVMVRFEKLNEGVKWRSTTLRFNYAGSQ